LIFHDPITPKTKTAGDVSAVFVLSNAQTLKKSKLYALKCTDFEKIISFCSEKRRVWDKNEYNFAFFFIKTIDIFIF